MWVLYTIMVALWPTKMYNKPTSVTPVHHKNFLGDMHIINFC